MSVEALAVVLHHSKARGTAKLVLLGIANHDGDGGAWPTIATLTKYAAANRRNVQKAIETLKGLGELRVHVQAGGTADLDDYSRPNRYDVLVACPPWCDRSKNHRDTRTVAGRQGVLRDARPVDKGGVGSDTPPSNRQGGASVATPGGASVATPKPSTRTSDNPVSASTTEDNWPISSERPPPPARPPADELAQVRERLRTASDQHHRREHRH